MLVSSIFSFSNNVLYTAMKKESDSFTVYFCSGTGFM